MRYFSTFSRIGGFELGINLAYAHYLSLRSRKYQKRNGKQDSFKQGMESTKKSSQHRRNSSNPPDQSNSELHPNKPECAGFSEINKYAEAIYRFHFPTHKNYGDITTIKPKELPDFNLLVGGFPCQAFFAAGKRKGFNDPRGTIFFELARIIREKQPRFLLLENVTGLLSHEKGKTFATILTTLYELGYDAEWQILNSKHFGVPQNRKRVFIMGHLRGECFKQILPLGSAKGVHSEKAQKKIYAKYTHSQAICQLEWELDQIRRLTPRECERLQSFPNGWTEKGLFVDGIVGMISDSQRYRVLGNAATIGVVEEVFRIFL